MDIMLWYELNSVYALLAQLDRVAHYECEGWGFESLMAHQKPPVIVMITGGCFYLYKISGFLFTILCDETITLY